MVILQDVEGRDSIAGAESLHWEKLRLKVNMDEIVKGIKVKFQTISEAWSALQGLSQVLLDKKNHFSFQLIVSH